LSGAASFLRAFLRAPRTIGAVASSGPALASRMVECAKLEQGHCVVEIGAGQGPMTTALVEHGHPPALVFELYEQWADALASRFPDLPVVQQSAADMPSQLHTHGLPLADRVVSSLPWAIWSDTLQDTILSGVVEGMQPDGRMVTFTYVHGRWLPSARRFRRKLESHFRSVTTSSIVWKNLPPAVVYQCDR
jgi:phosphatidylethanolamine/phosphatidyl-N-methylethanolamine N-methyltransferase